MKLYLLEAYDPNIQFDDGAVVALTPEVCYHLDKNRIDYNIIDDFYDEDDIFEDRYAFLEDQRNWFEDFDNFLKENVGALNRYDFNLASTYSTYIKTNIVDLIILKSYILKSLFNELNPSCVIFVTLPLNEKVLTDNLRYSGKSIYAQLIPLLCKKYSIPLTELWGYSAKDVKNVTSRRSKTFRGIWKYIPGILKIMGSIFSKKKQSGTLNILQLNFSYNGLDVIKNGFIRGHNVYLLSGNRIFKFYRLGIRIFDIEYKSYGTENVLNDWNQAAQLLETHELIKWINEKCSLDVSDIVLPNLKHFILNVCPDLLRHYMAFIAFYERESISIVVSPYMQSTIELGAIAAANKYGHTKTMCVEHGDDIFTNLFWRLKELTNFDVLVVSDKENKRYLESICNQYNTRTNVYSISERMSPIIKIGDLRKTGKFNNLSKKNEIIYLPTFFTWDALRIDANIHISPTKYYKFQKSLLEYFSEKKDYTFIWKGLLQSESIYNPIPDLIIDNNIINVHVETEPFKKYLPYANKVILDYPSTGMYESIIAGVPTICLCSDKLNVRKSGTKLFENVIKFYNNVDEAIGYMDDFVSADSEKYTAHLNTCDKNLIDIIELEYGI